VGGGGVQSPKPIFCFLFGCRLQDLAICTPPDVALPATFACHCHDGGQDPAPGRPSSSPPPPFRSSHPSISRPSLVGARAPKVPGLGSPLLSFSSPVHPPRQLVRYLGDRRCRPTPGAQVFVGSFAGEATSTHHQVCAPPFLPFGYLYSDLSRFDKCIMPTKLKNFVQKLLVVHVYTHVLYCSAPATAPFNSTTRG
jgi:hypothetical protein